MEGGEEPVGIHYTLNMIVGTEVTATLVCDGGKLKTEGGWERIRQGKRWGVGKRESRVGGRSVVV